MSTKELSEFPVTGTDPDLEEFENYVFESMGDSLFTIDNELSLVYYSLKQVEPFKSELDNDEAAISEACVRVMQYFKLDNWLKDKNKSPIKIYFNDLLELDSPPLFSLSHLQSMVYEDLRKLQDLIKRYEKDSFIESYLKDDEQPRNHGDKTKRDFYKRCIEAQNEISNYLISGIKKRALQKAKFVPDFLKEMFSRSFNDAVQDRPYSFGNPYKDMMQFYDYKKIDLFHHRLVDADAAEIPKLEELYAVDKASFYDALAKLVSPAEVLHSFPHYLSQLPFQFDRKVIFKELETLFTAEHWIGFYSLALTQVEGIFSEMSGVLSKKANSSLSDKVRHVRPYYHLSKYYFDYYEYHVPNQRNKFMHSGYDEDFHLKSLDLLYDIYHLFNVFMELNNPMVKLSKIHNTRNQQAFYSVSGFAEYFNLLNDINNEDRIKMNGDIISFEKTVLCEGGLADSICSEAFSHIPNLLLYFKDSLDRNLQIYDTTLDFENANKKIIEEFITVKKNRDALSDTLCSYEAEDLMSYTTLIGNYKRHLPSLNTSSVHSLTSIHKQYWKLLNLISQANELVFKRPT